MDAQRGEMLDSPKSRFRSISMATSQQPSSMIRRFGSFELDAAAAELRKNGTLIKLQPQPLKVLFLLIQHAGQVVTREEIQQCLWSDSTFVDFERGINFSINQIRGALADNADKPRYIETLPRRGYRFIAELKQEGSAKEVPSAHAPVAANDPAAAGGNGANMSPAPASLVLPLPRVVVATGWSRWRLILAGMTAAIGFLAFAGVAAYRAVFPGPRISFDKLQISKLTDSGSAVDVAMSPDGRYVVYAMRAAGGSSLRLRDVDTRGDVEILPPEGVYFHGLTFSPDGKYIYFVDTPKNSEGLNSLFTMPVLGGSPHLLGKYADTPVSFSPNGQEFAYTQGLADRNMLEVRIANADGSGDRLVASIPDGAADFQPGPAWSPDGRTIAVPVMVRGKKVRWVLAAVSVPEGSVRELYSYPHEIGRAVWLPDGDAILMMMRDQTRRGQLWALSYPRGKAVRLTNDLENYQYSIDATRDGKNVAVIATTQASNVWVVPDAGALTGRQITSNAVPLTQVTAMPPGKVLAGSAGGEMWLMKTDGSERTPFTTVRNAYSPARCGRSVVFNSFQDDTIDLIHVDSDGLNPTRLLHGDVGPPTCSTDGHSIFFASKIKPYVILRLSSGGGSPIEIAKSPGYEILGRLAISPDGKFLAYAYDEALPATGSKLAVIPVSGGAPLQTFKVPSDVSNLRWSPDGKALQYLLTRGDVTNICEQPLAGGASGQFTKFTSGRIFDFDWSADRKQLLLARGDTSSDVVLIRNFR
jgi:DNA-binding winged helix-turn-helix (wHTH) protein/Tol biopolymer transport system component